jgi:hypothetical protein
MANRLTMARIQAILSLHERGWRKRRIARELSPDVPYRFTWNPGRRLPLLSIGMLPPGVKNRWYYETARIAGDAHLFVGLDRSLWARRAGVRNSL